MLSLEPFLERAQAGMEGVGAGVGKAGNLVDDDAHAGGLIT